jgi:cytochrome b561
LLWRIGDPPPPPEQTLFGRWGERAGVMMHYALYGLVIAVIVLGVAVQFARGDALPVFWFEIGSPWPADRALARTLKEIHEVLANGLIIFAGLHALAALIHHWILRDRTLLRMLPGSSR